MEVYSWSGHKLFASRCSHVFPVQVLPVAGPPVTVRYGKTDSRFRNSLSDILFVPKLPRIIIIQTQSN